MDERLKIETIRGVLDRLEDTIIFALIERAQFKRNDVIYDPGAFGSVISPNECLVGYLLHETEKIHARMRRYTNFEEVPFYNDLPDPILPPRNKADNLARPNKININAEIRRVYEQETVPRLCQSGDDGQHGSSSVCDVTCLQAISTRIHYGKIIAESKYRNGTKEYDDAIKGNDREALTGLLTDDDVEKAVLRRVNLKATTYGQEPGAEVSRARIDAGIIANLYRLSIIPLTKEVEIRYLLGRCG